MDILCVNCTSTTDMMVKKIVLTFKARKISICKGLMDTETFERETASFEVELSHANVEGVWQKDGLRVKPNNTFRVSTNGCVHGLTLTNLTLEDTGTITFSAEGLRISAQLLVKGGWLTPPFEISLVVAYIMMPYAQLRSLQLLFKVWMKLQFFSGESVLSPPSFNLHCRTSFKIK